MKQQASILALFLGATSAVRISSNGPYTEQFVDAAIKARIEADKDINIQIKERLNVSSNEAKNAWKKHLKESSFYKKFAQHEKEVKTKGCGAKCQKKKQELLQLQSQYKQLNHKFNNLEKNVPEDNLVQLKGDDNNEKIIVRGEKEWQTWAQDLNDWSDNQTLMANTRIPYNSFIQLEGEPNNEPIIVRGEKEWQAWAQDLNDWSDGQTDAANSRIPYNSAVQLENEPIIVRGEKEWQAWAQDQNDQLDRQTDAANSRIPYQSTLINTAVLDPVGEQAFINIASDLVQLGNEPIIVRGEKEWQAWAQDQNDQLDRQTDAANSRIPYQSTLLNTAVLDPVGEQSWMEQASELVQIGNEPIIVRGEKEWQTWAQDQNDQLDKATDTANARIPYNSAIQTSDEKEDDLLVENNNLVPLNFRF